MSDSSSPIDARVFQELRALVDESRPTFLRDVIDRFLKVGSDGLAAMKEALSSGDAEVLRRHAHTLTGSSGGVGAGRLSRLCGQLEALAREGRASEGGALLGEIEVEYARVKAALLEERSR